jgi:BirA family biotin operon repressor/biotin-[acetyl-CoA-carboxylase] ligase
MDISAWKSRLEELPLGDLYLFQEIGSTNQEALDLVQRGAPPFTLVLADSQTAGKGRQGRSWVTKQGKALAISMILYPDEGMITPENLGKLSGLGSLAVAEGINKIYQLESQIKWPNDVLVNGKKVCGILVDLHWKGAILEAAVIGIGINVYQGSVPEDIELMFPAGSLEECVEGEISRLDLLLQVVNNLLEWYPKVTSDDFLTVWREKLAYKNQEVVLISAGKKLDQGVVLGLNEDGSLILGSLTGEERYYQTGEIQLRLVDR